MQHSSEILFFPPSKTTIYTLLQYLINTQAQSWYSISRIVFVERKNAFFFPFPLFFLLFLLHPFAASPSSILIFLLFFFSQSLPCFFPRPFFSHFTCLLIMLSIFMFYSSKQKHSLCRGTLRDRDSTKVRKKTLVFLLGELKHWNTGESKIL